MTILQRTDSQPTIVEAENWLLTAVQVWGLIVLSLHLAAYKLPEETAWSVWPYTWLPPWLGWTLALVAGVLTVPAVNGPVVTGLSRLWQVWPARSTRFRPYWFGLAALLAGFLFWVARLGHLKWGDAYVLSVRLSYPDLELRVIYNWQAPFTVFLHQRLWQFVADPLLSWPVVNVYAAVSITCGIIFVYLLLTFAAQLGRRPLEAAVLAGLVLTTGSMQLFFGYVENYTVISLGLLITMILAWAALQGRVRLVWPTLAFAVTNGFHPSTVFLAPAMLLLAWLCWRRGRVSLASGLVQLVIPPLLVAGAVLILMESGGHGLAALLGEDRPGGGDGTWFVPLFATTTQWEHYTMFSTAHLLDWSNEHLLISPFGLPLIVLTLLAIYRFRLTVFDNPTDKDYASFLGVLAGAYLLLTWLWNPDYGGQQDWDLFAPAALVYTWLSGYLLVRTLPGRLAQAAIVLAAISLLHTGAWVWLNTQPLPRK